MSTEKLNQWNNSIKILHLAHNLAATKSSEMNIRLGIPAVIFSTIVGTAVFSTLESSNETISYVVAFISIVSAILTALQTFLDFGKNAEKHKTAAISYGELRREIDHLQLQFTQSKNIGDKLLKRIITKWDTIEKTSPTISQKLINRAYKMVIGKEI